MERWGTKTLSVTSDGVVPKPGDSAVRKWYGKEWRGYLLKVQRKVAREKQQQQTNYQKEKETNQRNDKAKEETKGQQGRKNTEGGGEKNQLEKMIINK